MSINANVAVIVLNYGSAAHILECLDSLRRLEYGSYYVVVVDNGSKVGTVEQIAKWIKYTGGHLCDATASTVTWQWAGHRIFLIQTGKNLGYAGGNNVGIRYALSMGADYVWILNNDTEVHPDSLTRLVERAEEDESIGICGSTLLYYHDRTRVQALGGAKYNKWLGVTKPIGGGDVWGRIKGTIDRDAVERQMDYVAGASMLVSRKFIEKVGLMCEEYFLYYEELDWAIRGKKHGFRLAWAPDSIVYHKEGATTGGGADPRQRSLRSDYWSIRNRIYFTYKFYPYALPTIYFGLLGAIFNRVRRRQFNHAMMIARLMLRGRKTFKP